MKVWKSMLKLVRSTLFVCAALTIFATQAKAAPVSLGAIGPTCGTCQGATYILELIGPVADLYVDGNTTDTFQFKLTIDATGYNGGGVAIDEVAIKVASQTDKMAIVDAPGGKTLWNVVPGGLNADGCAGSGGGYQCADWHLTTGSAAVVGTILSWTFNIDLGSVMFDGTTGMPSIKVRYVDDKGKKVGDLVSEQVPEPGTLALLGIGASLAAIRRRRAQR